MKPLRFVAYMGLFASTVLTGCGGSSNTGGTNSSPPTPTVSSISPTTVAAGASSLTLTVYGTGFLSTTVIQIGGVSVPSTYVSSTQVDAVVPASQLLSGALLSVIALNGSVSSGSGTPVNLQVTNPAPAVISLLPLSLMAGSAAQTLTINGSGFVPTSTVTFNGISHAATYINASQLTIALTLADLAAFGTYPVVVTNSTPGGGTSAAAQFSVTAASAFIRTINISANNILWDAAHSKIYASLSSGNSIAVIDPVAGAVVSQQAVSNSPDPLAISDDDSFLYAGLDARAQSCVSTCQA